MGLLSILKKVKEKEHEVRLLILGLDNAGKTTVVKKFKGEDVGSISPTLGFSISTFEFHGFVLNFWDVGGQRKIRAYWRNYFEQTDGLIWVVDSSDRARLDNTRQELRQLLNQEKLAGASLLILANKQDLFGAYSAVEIRDALGLTEDDVSGRHWAVQGCSAFTGDGLLEGISWLVTDISSRIFVMN